MTEKSDLLKSTNISPMLSNEDNLELARLKASQVVVNLDQFYPEILSKFNNDSTVTNDDSIDNSGTLDATDNESRTLDFTDDTLALDDNDLILSKETKLTVGDRKKSTTKLITRTWTGGKIPNTVPLSMNQILDIQTSNHYAAGMVASKSGRLVKAIAHFSRCVHLKPKEPLFYVCRADVFVQLVDFQSAIVNYKRACFLDPTNDDNSKRLALLYVMRSQVLSDQGLHMRALESIGRAMEIFPNNPLYELRAIVCLAALDRHRECLGLINKQIDENEPNADFFVLRAKLQTHFRAFSLSYHDLIEALRIDSSHQEAKLMLATMTEQADDFKNAAVQLALHNRLLEAINKMTMAIDLNPKVGDYHIKRGAFYRRLKNFPAAVDDFILAQDKVDHDEQHDTFRNAQRQIVLTFNDFAVECFENQCFEESIRLINRAIQWSDRIEPLFYLNRGDCFFKTRQWDFALADYNQARSVSDELHLQTRTRIGLVYFSIGYEKFINGDGYQESELAFTKAIENNPLSSVFWNSRAKCRYLLENYPGSKTDLISGLVLSSELDRGMESIFNRLFQNRTVSQVIRSKLGQQVKMDLDRLVKERDEIIGGSQYAEGNFRASPVVPKASLPDKIKSCMTEDRLYADWVDFYHYLDKKLKQSSTDKKSIKNSRLNISPLPDFNVSTESVGRDCNIMGIVGMRDGQKFFMDSEGVMVKTMREKGWRKFQSTVELK